MIDFVFRFSDLETYISKLSELGIETRPSVDEDGNTYTIEERAGVVMTPVLITILGNLVSCVRLSEDEAAKVPDVTSPTFLCDWRSDEVEEDTDGNSVQLPWPEYEVATYDEDGNQSGTVLQGAGRIA